MSRSRLIEQLYRDRYIGFRNALAPLVGSREAAHDVVQEAFARALKEAHRLKREESLAAWVWQIAMNLALRERGRPKTDELPDDLMIVEPERDPTLAALVHSLPPKRRVVLFLRYYANFTYAEIAEALGVAEVTFAATISQAHASLLDELLSTEVTS
jgi:RNA polymerase sigma factor (sigma-70 family)